MELEDERTRLLSNFQLPESVYVNVGSKKDFDVIKKTVEGNVDMKRYNLVSISIRIEQTPRIPMHDGANLSFVPPP